MRRGSGVPHDNVGVSMPSCALFEAEAKSRVNAVVQELELRTSAEIVVVMRIKAGSYRQADYLWGAGLAFVALMVFLFHPAPFPIAPFPAVALVAFVVGATISAYFEPLQRLLVPRSKLVESARAAAIVDFYERGITRTRGRTGVLVFVSIFERSIVVVPDVGIDENALGEAYRSAKTKLGDVLLGSLETTPFEEALRTLGSVLADALPRAHDDENELSDEVVS